jgi:hypothetical protein
MILPSFTAPASIYRAMVHYDAMNTEVNTRLWIFMPTGQGDLIASSRDLCISQCMQIC